MAKSVKEEGGETGTLSELRKQFGVWLESGKRRGEERELARKSLKRLNLRKL